MPSRVPEPRLNRSGNTDRSLCHYWLRRVA
jgi:hypothetical protein